MIAVFVALFCLPHGAVRGQSTSTGSGQAYPSKPIRFVLSFGPGSASDVLARIVGQELMQPQSLGQPVVVLPKPGADGALSALEVKRAAADGYTFLWGTNSAYSAVPNMRKEPPYNVLTDFSPVTYVGDNTYFIAVHPSLPVKTLNDLIAHAKANPKVLNYPAANTYALVATAMFSVNNGIQMVSVPYKSEPDAIIDLLSGRLNVIFGTSTGILAHVKDGKLRALATTFHERSPLLPDAPSFPEVGQGKFPIGPWFGLVGPAGLTKPIVARMNKEMVAVLAKTSVKEAMLKHGFIARSSTPEALAAHIKDQLAVWKSALKAAGVEPQ
jgi:tripartite-type tricarboxylate transporter receptor subunit TctC